MYEIKLIACAYYDGLNESNRLLDQLLVVHWCCADLKVEDRQNNNGEKKPIFDECTYCWDHSTVMRILSFIFSDRLSYTTCVCVKNQF